MLTINPKRPLALELTFITADRFKVNGVGEGQLFVPFETGQYSFTIIPEEESRLRKKTFALTLIPKDLVIRKLQKNVKVEEDEDDSSLLNLSCYFPSRERSEQILNTMMQAYQAHLYADHDRQSRIQITYLRKKQEEAMHELAMLLSEQAENASQEIAESGFADIEKELEALYKARVDLENKKTNIKVRETTMGRDT